MAYDEITAQLVRENEALRQQIAGASGSTPLEIAQRAFEGWLRQVDAILEEAQLNFEEAAGAGRNGDATAYEEAIGRAIGCVDIVRREIAGGLAQGV